MSALDLTPNAPAIIWNLLGWTLISNSIAGIDPKSKTALSTRWIVFCLFSCSKINWFWMLYSSYSLLKKNVVEIIITNAAAYLTKSGTLGFDELTLRSLYFFNVDSLYVETRSGCFL